MIKAGVRAVLAAAALCLPGAGAWADAPSGAFTATVTQDKAVFSFPLDTSQSFQWNQTSDPAGTVEYRWTVGVSDGGATYQVGYFHVKAASDAAERGDLADLLREGQLGVFRQDDAGRYQMLDGANVTADVRKGALVVTVTGSQMVDRVFSARPSSVTFEAATPGYAPDIEDVLANYAY